MALTQVTTNAIADDAVTTDKLANAINTARDANTAKVTNATHSGEVTGSGALTITDDTVDEANLKISNAGSNGQFLQKQSGNTGGLTWATATSVGGATGVDFNDDVKARFGTGNDLEIYHLGDVNIINAAAGTLSLRHDNETMLTCGPDAAVELYYDNSKKLETQSDGVTVSGWLYIPDSDGSNNMLRLGNGADLQIYHNGSDSYIAEVGTGSLKVLSHDYQLKNAANDETMIRAMENDTVELYHNGNKKLWTRSDGIEVTGKGVFSNHIYLPDDVKLIMGDNPDLEIKHESNLSTIKNTHANGLAIRSDIVMLQNAAGDHDYLTTVNEEGVSLYYDNNLRFKTNSGGCQLRGTINYVETLLRPWTATGVDLGTSDDRFQNLYLHGNLYLGGTGSSNAMDDYEEGTWTPDLSAMTSLSFNSRGGRYTKIGRFVWVAAYMNVSQRTGTGGHMKVTGLPFTCADEIARGGGRVVYASGLTSDTYDVPTLLIENNQTQAGFFKGDGSTFSSESMHMSQGSIYITFTYEVA